MTNQSKVEGKRSIRVILTTVIALLLAVSIFASTAFAGNGDGYKVDIVVDSEAITVTTTETEPIEILENAGITLSANDKIDISSFDEGVGGTIVIQKLHTINVDYDNEIKSYNVYSSTVGDALNEAGVSIATGDSCNYNLTDKVEDGMVIAIKTMFYVTLNADGSSNEYGVIEGTVSDLLRLANVTLGADDYTEPSVNTELSANMNVVVCRVEYKEVTRNETIAYSTTTIEDDTLTIGKTKTVTAGVDGSKTVNYKVKYVNGKENSKQALSETINSNPTNAVVKVGTKAEGVVPNGVSSYNGFTLGQNIKGKYTHYCACATCNGNSRGITTSGRRISNGMANPYYIACNWLPLGSVISVDGVNYTVVDRGGSGLSRVGRIDIFTPEGHSACYRYGTGSCSITILRLGW